MIKCDSLPFNVVPPLNSATQLIMETIRFDTFIFSCCSTNQMAESPIFSILKIITAHGRTGCKFYRYFLSSSVMIATKKPLLITTRKIQMKSMYQEDEAVDDRIPSSKKLYCHTMICLPRCPELYLKFLLKFNQRKSSIPFCQRKSTL